ncbi:hypothetical protein KQI65_13955 [bacterium]|nr:hypothetical protein [bacterium]
MRLFLLLLLVSGQLWAQSLHRTATSPLRPFALEFVGGPTGEQIVSVTGFENGTLFAGTVGHGVLKSTNGGASWEKTGLQSGDIAFLYATPANSLIAFSYTGYISWRSIWISRDGGMQWEQQKEEMDMPYGWSVVHRTGSAIFSEGGGGLHRSDDNGRTWTVLRDSAFDKCCSGDYLLEFFPDGNALACNYRTLYRSADNGKNWDKIQPGITAFTSMFHDGLGNVVMAARDTAAEFGAPSSLYRVSPEGAVLEKLGPAPMVDGPTSTIVLSDGLLLAGHNEKAEGIFRSTDAGRTWVDTLMAGTRIADFHLGVDGSIFAATAAGLYRSRDNGTSWKLCSMTTAPRTITAIETDSLGTLYAGTMFGGLYASTDDGGSWEVLTSIPSTVQYCHSARAGQVLIWTEVPNSMTIYTLSGPLMDERWGWSYDAELTLDGGSSWTRPTREHLSATRVATHGRFNVYSNSTENNYSTDGGITWQTDAMYASAKDITYHFKGMYVLRRDSLLYRAHGADSWELFAEFDWPGSVVSVEGNLLVTDSDGMHRLEYPGREWSTVISGLTSREYEHAVSDWFGAVAMTGGRGPLLLSTNLGSTWTRIGVEQSGLLQEVYTSVFDREGRLLVGTSAGLYRSDATLAASYFPMSFTLRPPFPNPASNYAIIPFKLDEPGHVRLTLHDTSGKEMYVLLDGDRIRGDHQATLYTYMSRIRLHGLYFISLSAHGRVQTQPIVFQ